MGARPGRIRRDFIVPFARPRALSLKRDPAFLKLADSIWAEIEDETRRAGLIATGAPA